MKEKKKLNSTKDCFNPDLKNLTAVVTYEILFE